jgi:hypothetical protein
LTSENANWDGEVGHVCDQNLSLGYRTAMPQVTSVPAEWVLVSTIAAKLNQHELHEVWMSYWRASGKDGGVNAATHPQFEYRYIGGDAKSGKGGRKWTRDYSMKEIQRILSLTPEAAQAEFSAAQEEAEAAKFSEKEINAEETPAVIEETPAVIEETPAVIEETPTVVE